MDFRSAEGEQRYDAIVGVADRTIVGLDFDGTLAPIVDDPTQARIHPDAAAALIELAEQVAGIAVITGRPVRQALQLGDLEEVGREILAKGKVFDVFGQYGKERWSPESDRIVSPRPPRGLASFERELPQVLRSADAVDAFVEDKGLAVAVHTRRLPDPDLAFARLVPLLTELAERNGLGVEPGKQVIEVRADDVHKGMVVERLAAEQDIQGFMMAGDDLGDVEAFVAVELLRDQDVATLRVCSTSTEESGLLALADVAVAGPDGVVALLRRFAADARRRRTD